MKDIAMANKFEIFEKHKDTLMNLSFDSSHNEFMTDSQLEAINFDKVKTTYLNDLVLSEICSKSVDALIFDPARQIFIEFKNGKIESYEIKTKIFASLLIFSDITGETISKLRKTLQFVLVYNPIACPISTQEMKQNKIQESQSRDAIAKYTFSKSGEEFIRFGLERFKSFYFKAVHTYTKQEFEGFLNKIDDL